MAERDIKDLEKPMKIQSIRDFFEKEVMQFIFSRSQENLVTPMPFPRTSRPKGRTSSVIFDQGFLMRSCTGPFWEGDTVKLVYDAPYAFFVEFGTDPHPVSHKHFIKWAMRKLRISNKKKAVSVAYAVAKTIEKYGTDPHPFLRPAINEAIVKYGFKVKQLKI